MINKRPVILLTDAPTPSKELHSFLLAKLGRPVCVCPYQQLGEVAAWHRPETILLVAAEASEYEQIAALNREIRLRQPPWQVTLVQTGIEPLPREVLSAAPPAIAQFCWPGSANALVERLQSHAPGRACPPREHEALASRVAALTPSLLPLVSRLAVAATHDVTVLLTGETGTGKSYLARLLHDFSPRRQHPFLAVPCGSQPASLFESAFFGHLRGSFTGADQTRKGKFAAAGKGTILLDEIDTLGLEQQASLLRVIETGEFEAVGSNETQKSEARMIVSSNWNLEEAVEKGKFRQDLYYRLSVMPFHLQPLRLRRTDIPVLARSFAAQFNEKFGKGLSDICPLALELLQDHPWPGNIRQMENCLQQAVLMSAGPMLQISDFPAWLSQDGPRNGQPPVPADTPELVLYPGGSLQQSRSDHERRLILTTLQMHEQNRTRAAKALGISRVTLHKKIKQYGLKNGPQEV